MATLRIYQHYSTLSKNPELFPSISCCPVHSRSWLISDGSLYPFSGEEVIAIVKGIPAGKKAREEPPALHF